MRYITFLALLLVSLTSTNSFADSIRCEFPNDQRIILTDVNIRQPATTYDKMFLVYVGDRTIFLPTSSCSASLDKVVF